MKTPLLAALALLIAPLLPVHAAEDSSEQEAKILKAATEQGLAPRIVAWMPDPEDQGIWKFPGFAYEGKSEVLPASAAEPFGNFRRYTLLKETDASWSHKNILKVPKAFQAGDNLHLIFWVRAGNSETAGRSLPVDVSSRPDQGKIQTEIIRTQLAEEWQFVQLEIPVIGDLAEGELNIAFHLGGALHATEVGGLALLKD